MARGRVRRPAGPVEFSERIQTAGAQFDARVQNTANVVLAATDALLLVEAADAATE
jgi:hypothetical protein